MLCLPVCAADAARPLPSVCAWPQKREKHEHGTAARAAVQRDVRNVRKRLKRLRDKASVLSLACVPCADVATYHQ